jgi:predicted ester cyclase
MVFQLSKEDIPMLSIEELKDKSRLIADEVWNKGNLEICEDIFAPGFVRHQPPYPDMDFAAFKQHILNTRAAYPDVKITLDEPEIFEGNRSAGRWTFRGTQTGQSPTTGAEPTGKQVTFTGCSVDHWVDDKIVERWEYIDWLGLLQQLGVVPK